jgi:spore coat polysaccharide biosynthesis protein SpsF (cytidylyltransferase family)
MKTLAIVQARENSSRLPGKVRMYIQGSPMVTRVAMKVAAIVGRTQMVVAWPAPGENEEDVLSRFVRVLSRHSSDYTAIARFTADCPLLDTAYSNHLIGLFQYLRAENATQAPELLATHPDLDGLDTEIFTRHALMEANDNARGADREHVTSWMRRHIPTKIVTMPLLGGPIRWSVDDAGGLEFVRRVTGACADCALGVPHHSNSSVDIGGPDRSMVIDLHVGVGGGLVECTAADILRERMGPSWAYSSLPK